MCPNRLHWEFHTSDAVRAETVAFQEHAHNGQFLMTVKTAKINCCLASWFRVLLLICNAYQYQLKLSIKILGIGQHWKLATQWRYDTNYLSLANTYFLKKIVARKGESSNFPLLPFSMHKDFLWRFCILYFRIFIVGGRKAGIKQYQVFFLPEKNQMRVLQKVLIGFNFQEKFYKMAEKTIIFLLFFPHHSSKAILYC